MNFRVKDRIALAIYALIGLCGSVAVGLIGYNILILHYNITRDIRIFGYSVVGMVVIVAALILFIYSCGMLRLAFRHKPKKDRNSVSVQNTDQGNGEVRVSVQALDALVKQAIAGNSEGVADIKTSIVNHEDSISVKIEMGLHGDAHIPNITMLLQSSIKSFIEEYSGIAVRDVSIMVKTIIPVMPQLAIEEKTSPEPVVLEDDEHSEMPAPVVDEVEEIAAEEAPVVEEAVGEAIADAEEAAFEDDLSIDEPVEEASETPEEKEQNEAQEEA